jgi:hypothetical protein
LEGNPAIFSEELSRDWDILEVLGEVASLDSSAVAEGG